MEFKKAYLPKGEVREFKKGESIFSILECEKEISEPMLAIVDGEEVEDLSKKLYYDVSIKPLYINDNLGEKTYLRTLQMVFIMAVRILYPDYKVIFKNSLSRGLYGELENIKITQENIDLIKEKMAGIIDSDLEIEKLKFKKAEAIKVFEDCNMEDKIKSIKYADVQYVSIYRCEDFYNYFYGNMLPSTGYLKLFDVIKNNGGFILMSPTKRANFTLEEFKDSPKLAEIFDETQRVSDILDVSSIGTLNEKVEMGGMDQTILVTESLHEKKIASIADEIYRKKGSIKLITVGGPSCSGKYTFTKRLSIQLRLLGFKPYMISLNNYLLDRKYAPSEEGKYHLETIEGIDVELFNSNIEMLLDGKEVEIPKFDFALGRKSGIKEDFKMTEKTILIVYGVHGLNTNLIKCIPKEELFKIYVSSLTQLSMDNHNAMEPKDLRECRKILKAYNNYNIKAEDTIASWAITDRVENESVFLHQEDADAMFNSTVFYEMNVIKKYIEPLLKRVPKRNPSYVEAKRILDFVSFFREGEEKNIPQNSIIREFIGNSCF